MYLTSNFHWLLVIDVPRPLTPLSVHDASPFQCTLARNPTVTTCISSTEVFLCTCGLLEVPGNQTAPPRGASSVLGTSMGQLPGICSTSFPRVLQEIKFICLIVHLHRLSSILCFTPPLSYLCLVGSPLKLIICTGIFAPISTPRESQVKTDKTLYLIF